MAKVAPSATTGLPALFVDGRELDGAAYMCYYTENSRYRDFYDVGYRLFSLPVFFATRTLNEAAGLPPFQIGIFEDADAPDFTGFDRNVENILSDCPEAWLLPRVNMNLPRRWDADHPDECCDTATGPAPCPCFSSSVWLEDIRKALTSFIGHCRDARFSNRIIGYQLAAGNTEEWFSFDAKGSIGKAAFRAFAQRGGGDTADFYRFLSERVSYCIASLARTVKELTRGERIVGAFYGYTFECPFKESCHHDMSGLLRSPDIDFISSPVSYADRRPLGQDHPNMTALDSVKLHGKLYFAENDTRTHLSRPPCDLPHYQNPIWTGPDRDTTLEIMRMHFARALIHGHGFWWFDMWGGWYGDPAYMAFMRECLGVLSSSRTRSARSVSPLCVVADERSLAATDAASGSLLYSFRKTLGLCGIPYDVYLADDAAAVIPRYRAVLLLAPVMSDALIRIRDVRPDAVVIDASNADMSARTLRAVLTRLGIRPVLGDRDAVVYENESYLFIHLCDGLPLPESLIQGMREVFGRGPVYGFGKSLLFEKPF